MKALALILALLLLGAVLVSRGILVIPQVAPPPTVSRSAVFAAAASAKLESYTMGVETLAPAARPAGFLGTNGEMISVAVVGAVTAGVDLAALKAEDVQVVGGNVTIILPPAAILSTELDEARTRVQDRELSWWSYKDDNLVNQARQAGKDDLRRLAIEQGILTKAHDSSAATIARLVSAVAPGAHVEVR